MSSPYQQRLTLLARSSVDRQQTRPRSGWQRGWPRARCLHGAGGISALLAASLSHPPTLTMEVRTASSTGSTPFPERSLNWLGRSAYGENPTLAVRLRRGIIGSQVYHAPGFTGSLVGLDDLLPQATEVLVVGDLPTGLVRLEAVGYLLGFVPPRLRQAAKAVRTVAPGELARHKRNSTCRSVGSWL